MRAVILLVCACVACLACGPAADSPASEPWPVFTEAPGVLGYVALPAAPGDIVDVCVQAFDWTPRGLSGEAPVSMLLLDEVVFGGPLAIALPIDDEAAFRDSLEACPLIRNVSGDSWVVALSADHPALKVLRVLRSLAAANFPADLIAAARDRSGVEWAVKLVISNGRAIVAPSFEAGLIARRVLDEVPGLGVAGGPIVLSLDAQHSHLAYQAEIDACVNHLRGLLVAAKAGSIASMLARMKSGSEGGDDLGFPLPGPAIWALVEMLSVEEIDGLQLSLNGSDVGARLREMLQQRDRAEEGSAAESETAAMSLELRMVWADASVPARLMGALRPVAHVPGAAALGFDPVLFPAALAEWARPLVELTMGRGRPAERLMDRIVELFAPCGGTVVAGWEPEGHALAWTVRPGEEFDVDGMGEVLGLFAHTLDLDTDDGLGEPQLWDGLTLVEGFVPARRYWQTDGMFFLTVEECAEDVLDRLAAHAEEAEVVPRTAGRAPFFALSADNIEVRMYAERDEFLFEWLLPSGLGR